MTTYSSILTNPNFSAGLVAHYDLEGDGVDSSPNALSGSYDTQPTIVVATKGFGLTFNGTANTIRLGTDSKFQNDYLSISAWIYRSGYPSTNIGSIVTKRTNGTWGSISYGLTIQSAQSGKIVFDVGLTGSTGVTLVSTTAPSLSTWYHVVATFDGSVARIYLNGVLDKEGACVGTIYQGANFPVVIGGRADGVSPFSGKSDYWNGRLDHITIFSKAISATDVNSLYNAGSALPYYAPSSASVMEHSSLNTGLVAHYEMYYSMTDQTGNLHDGISMNTPTYTTSAAPLGPAICIALNGTTQFVDLTNNSAFAPVNFGIAIWAYTNGAVVQENGIFCKRGSTGWANLDWSLQTYSDGGTWKWAFLISRDGATGVTLLSQNAIQASAWTHLAADYDGTTVRLFVNGRLHASSTSLSGDMQYRASNYRVMLGAYGAGAGGTDPTSDTTQFYGWLTRGYFYNRAFTVNEIRDMYNGYSSIPYRKTCIGSNWDIFGQSALRTSALVHYNFESNLLDAGPNRINGTGTPVYNANAKMGDSSAGCGQVSESMTLGTSSTLNPDYITISMWIYDTNVAVLNQSFVTRFATPDAGSIYTSYSFHSDAVNPVKLIWMCSTGTGPSGVVDSITAPFNIAQNAWIHCVATFDGTYMKIYYNGILACCKAHSSPGVLFKNATIPTVIGARVNSASIPNGRVNPSYCLFDLVSIFNRALTYSEVLTLYNNAAGTQYDRNGLGEIFFWETGSYLLELPAVTDADAPDANTVRVSYNLEMAHSNPADPSDSLYPSNYHFSTLDGIPLTPTSVSVYQASPTIVDVVVNEMTGGASYVVEVVNVLSASGVPLNPDADSAPFVGAASTLPTVESATMTSLTNLRVQFDQLMLHNVTLQSTGNYHVSGPTTVTLGTVSVTDDSGKTRVDIVVSGAEMQIGGDYIVTVDDAEDTSYNHLDPAHNTAHFVGVGVAPQVLPTPVEKDSDYVVIRYDELMNSAASLPGSYTIVPALNVNTVVLYGDYYTYKLGTDTQTFAEDYTLTVSSSVTDTAGNPIDPAHDTVEFTGTGDTPPEIRLIPDTGTEYYPIRSRVRVNIIDNVAAPTGVDLTSVWIKLSIISPEGGLVEMHIVKDGELQRGFEGELTGDPLDTTDGVTWSFIPKAHWLPNTLYTFTAYARDNEGTPNENEFIGTIAMGEATCTEDKVGTLISSSFDTAVWEELSSPVCDKMRKLLLSICSYASDDLVRSRTLLYLASRSDIQPFLSQYVDLSLLSGLCLCDRAPVLEIYQALMPYKALLPILAQEVSDDAETRGFFLRYINSNSPPYVVAGRYINSNSPPYVVAGVAAAVITAAMLEA